MAAETHKRACFRGAVAIAVTGPPLEMGYCHCALCRAYPGNPVNAYLLWRSADVTVTKGAEFLGGANRTGMSDRRFCTKCGGHVKTVHPGLGLTDVRPATILVIPFAPTVHLNYAETLLLMKDGLSKLRDLPRRSRRIGRNGAGVRVISQGATTTGCPCLRRHPWVRSSRRSGDWMRSGQDGPSHYMNPRRNNPCRQAR